MFLHFRTLRLSVLQKLDRNLVDILKELRNITPQKLKVNSFLINHFQYNRAGNYMLKVKSRNTRTRCETCSKLTIKIPERRHWRRSRIFIVNFEHVSHLVLMFLLLTSSR